MKVIVTGGTGLAGRNVVKELANAGHEVYNLDRRQDDSLPCEPMTIDLTQIGEVYDAFAQIKPEGVCHLAAQPRPIRFSRERTFINNTAITYNVFQVAAESGARRIINSSSEMAAGWTTHPGKRPPIPWDETTRIDSPNAYSLGKYVSEVMADSFVVRHPELSICSMRISLVIDPDRRVETISAQQEKHLKAGNSNYWSYVDGRDLGSAFRAALEGETTGHEVYMLASADTTLQIPIRQALKQYFGLEDVLPEHHGTHQSIFDCSKLTRHFGWTSRHTWRDS